LKNVEAIPIDVTTQFIDFDDYWEPFLGNVGPAPAYLMGLDPKERLKLKNILHESLPYDNNWSIPLNIRAWAVKVQQEAINLRLTCLIPALCTCDSVIIFLILVFK